MHPELSMPRYGGPKFQSAPGRTDFSNYTVDVFSPELPCGAGWLASALLELRVPLWRFWGVDIDSDWHRIGERCYRYENRFSPWSRIIAGLTDGRKFSFRAVPVPRFTHDLPGAWRTTDRLVVFVRDPRDALYSQWRRETSRGLAIDFKAWLLQTEVRWNLPRLLAYAMDIATWLCFARLTGTFIQTVRFEDTKLDPKGALRRIWRFIAPIEELPSEIEITCAVDDAHFNHARKIEDKLIADGVLSDRINFRGQAYEYKSRDDYSPVPFDGCVSDLFVWLGYEPLSTALCNQFFDPLCAPWLRDRVDRAPLERAVQLAASWVRDGARPKNFP